MSSMWKKLNIKNFALSLLFPRFCFCCQKEGSYLCEDCLSTIEISKYQYCLCQKPQRIWQGGKCQRCVSRKLNGLYFAAPYQNSLVQNLIHSFKYKPFIKELSKPLASLIINHFQLLDNPPDFFYPVKSREAGAKQFNGAEFLLLSIPLEKRKLKERGFNQAEELAKELSKSLKIPLLNDVLIKIKETLPQVELSGKKREENIKGVFLVNPVRGQHGLVQAQRKQTSNGVKNAQIIKGRKILLVDDVYTTGSTMEEGARVLKTAGAKEVWGVVVARG